VVASERGGGAASDLQQVGTTRWFPLIRSPSWRRPSSSLRRSAVVIIWIRVFARAKFVSRHYDLLLMDI
jgi:hypothetical protein